MAMAYQYSEFPELSWSFSKMRLIEECKLKHYYQTYGCHNGWLKDADPIARKLYLLKNLKPIDALFGEVFHNGVKTLVKDSISPITSSPTHMKRHITKNIQLHYKKSQHSKSEWQKYPKAFSMIAEVFYDSDIPQQKKENINRKTLLCSENLFLNSTFLDSVGNKYEIIELDELTQFAYQNVTCYLKIDALLKDQSSKYIVVDWKTSVSTSATDVDQLLPYVYNNYGVPVEMIECRLEYIARNETQTCCFTGQDLKRFSELLNADIKKLKEFISPGTENQPLELEKFYSTSNKRTCLNCNFRAMCILN